MRYAVRFHYQTFKLVCCRDYFLFNLVYFVHFESHRLQVLFQNIFQDFQRFEMDLHLLDWNVGALQSLFEDAQRIFKIIF